mgnify:CR=1 FL=1
MFSYGAAASTIMSETGDMVGEVVSTTLTVLVAVDVLLSGSVAVYVIIYTPTALVLTLPEVETVIEP